MSGNIIKLSDTFFKMALAFTLKWEGGFSNHVDDPGGRTMKGVTQTTYDKYREDMGMLSQDVAKITEPEIEDIYKRYYWDPAGCSEQSPGIAIALFDFAVNSGVKRAKAYLGYCLNAADPLPCYLHQREMFFKNIATGGKEVFLKGWLNRLNALREYTRGL